MWPKTRILEVYLNVAEFGPQVFGAEAASRQYFGKSASALSGREAALLAAVLPNPKRLSVRDPGGYVQQRQQAILAQVRLLEARGHYRGLEWAQ
jgi:monofunctional biosynthetic peptidoglycan transglycosylase